MLIMLRVVLCGVMVVGTQEWRSSHLDADGRYRLLWKVTGDTIVFQVEVYTTGWVGFGISPNGGMIESDVIIGWVSNGTTTFHDRYARRKAVPIIDRRKDWNLLWGSENKTHTTIRFQRKINTCDEEEDLPITSATTRVIYAFNDEDPTSPDSVRYHGPKNRGTKSLYLLEERIDARHLEEAEVSHWEIRSANVTIPHDADTTYLCTTRKRPHLDGLHHIVKIEPIIQPGNERFVHHMVLYECTGLNGSFVEPFLNEYHKCYSEDLVPNFSFCFTVVIGWAIGGEALYFPDYTGLPLGRENAVYYVLEVHYDNPGYETGIVDNSGLKITYTPKLRKYSSAVLAVGNLWFNCIFAPPGQKNFIVAGHAHPSCLNLIPPGGINIISVFLHSHLAGRKIRMRHFRDGEELAPIASEEYYDFNYQNFVRLPEERKVLPNDHLIMECSYDTSERRYTTFGGLSTKDEMCIAFLLYYPEASVTLSVSCPSPFNLVKSLGVTEISEDDQYVISPITGKNESYLNFLNSYPWDDNAITAVQSAMKFSPHLNICHERTGKLIKIFTLARYPDLKKAYKEPNECSSPQTKKNQTVL